MPSPEVYTQPSEIIASLAVTCFVHAWFPVVREYAVSRLTYATTTRSPDAANSAANVDPAGSSFCQIR